MDFQVLWTFVGQNQVYLVAGLLVFNLFILLLLVGQAVQLAKWKKKYMILMQGANGENLEQRLMEYSQLSEDNQLELKRLDNKFMQMEDTSKSFLQQVGIVRFNAFPDVGSDLSFAVALLDARGNGVVISNIYGRDDSRTFAKPVVNGQSTYRLSQEEERAIAKAMGLESPGE